MPVRHFTFNAATGAPSASTPSANQCRQAVAKASGLQAKYDEAKSRIELLEGQLEAARQRETEASLAAQVARRQMMRERCSRIATNEPYMKLERLTAEERVTLKAQQRKLVELNHALIRAREVRLPNILAKTRQAHLTAAETAMQSELSRSVKSNSLPTTPKPKKRKNK